MSADGQRAVPAAPPMAEMRRRARKWLASATGSLAPDRAGGSDRAVLVAGTARSGTTWVADVLASGLRARLMFEPFHADNVPEFAAFGHLPYRRRHEEDPDLQRFCAAVFEGKIRNRWIDGHDVRLFPRRRVVKAVRANLLLPWIRERFPEVPVVFVIRHPCAVVASWLRLGWSPDEDLAPMLRDARILDDVGAGDASRIVDAARSPEEKLAVVWSISNLVPLRLLAPDEYVHLCYECLVDRTDDQLAFAFERLGADLTRPALRTARRPSSTTRRRGALPRADGWRRELSPATVARIREVVARFGLADLYPDAW